MQELRCKDVSCPLAYSLSRKSIRARSSSRHLASPEALTYMDGLHPRVPDAQLNDIPGSGLVGSGCFTHFFLAAGTCFYTIKAGVHLQAVSLHPLLQGTPLSLRKPGPSGPVFDCSRGLPARSWCMDVAASLDGRGRRRANWFCLPRPRLVRARALPTPSAQFSGRRAGRQKGRCAAGRAGCEREADGGSGTREPAPGGAIAAARNEAEREPGPRGTRWVTRASPLCRHRPSGPRGTGLCGAEIGPSPLLPGGDPWSPGRLLRALLPVSARVAPASPWPRALGDCALRGSLQPKARGALGWNGPGGRSSAGLGCTPAATWSWAE